MKKLIGISAVVLLAACNQAEAPEATPTEEAVAAAPVVAPGAYDGVLADGSAGGVSTLNADGTYSDVDPEGAVVEEGTWETRDGKTCFAPTTEGRTAMCWTESERAADGTFTATPDEGDPVTVKPVAAE